MTCIRKKDNLFKPKNLAIYCSIRPFTRDDIDQAIILVINLAPESRINMKQ